MAYWGYKPRWVISLLEQVYTYTALCRSHTSSTKPSFHTHQCLIPKGNSLCPAFLLCTAEQQADVWWGHCLKQDRLCLATQTQNINWNAGNCPPFRKQHLSSFSTWSRRIWQTSGVKWRRAARDLLRIFKRLYCTVSSAFCSAASDSGLGCLEEAWGLRCTRGVTLDGRESPFFVCGERKKKILNTGTIILH